jgi:diphthamide biosynthesis methyltransferase
VDTDAIDEVTSNRSASRVTLLLLFVAETDDEDVAATAAAAAAVRLRVELAARRLEFANNDDVVVVNVALLLV